MAIFIKTITTVLLIVCCPATFVYGQSGTVKIGVITDLSGHGATWGKQSSLGIKLAEKDLRAAGKKVSIVVGDSRFQTTNGISEAQKMLFSDNVDAVYVEFSSIVAAVSPIVRNSNKLFYGASAGENFIASNPMAVKSYMDYQKGCRRPAQIWKDRGVKKIAVLRLVLENGERCMQGAAEVYPDIIDQAYNVGESLSSYVLKLKRDKVEAIVFEGYEQDSLNLAKALSEIGYKPLVASQADDMAVSSHLDNYREILDGLITYGFKPFPEEFKNKILAADPSNPEAGRNAVAIAYLAMMHIYDAVSGCPKNDVRCQLDKITQASPSDILSFKGYLNRKADFEYQYTSWKGARPEVIGRNSQ